MPLNPQSTSKQKPKDTTKPKLGEHPGSTQAEILSEPNWASETGHHRFGFKSPSGRLAGITNTGDEFSPSPYTFGPEAGTENEVQKAQAKAGSLKKTVEEGNLVSFRDVMKGVGGRREVCHPSIDFKLLFC